jgi:hypothetical protein
MLSGMVAFAEMKSMGLKNLNARSLPDFAHFIKLAKSDGSPDFTVDDIAKVAKTYAEHIHTARSFSPSTRINQLETVLNIARFHGSGAVDEIKDHVDAHHYARSRDSLMNRNGHVDEKLLADLTLYRSRLRKSLVHLLPEHDEAVEMLFREGFTPDQVGDYMIGAVRNATETTVRISALRKGIASSINDGWL